MLFRAVHHHHRQQIADFAALQDRRRRRIRLVAFFQPYLGTVQKERRFVRQCDADAGSADILVRQTHSFHFAGCLLIVRHRVALEHIAVTIEQQQADIVQTEKIAQIFVQSVQLADQRPGLRQPFLPVAAGQPDE